MNTRMPVAAAAVFSLSLAAAGAVSVSGSSRLLIGAGEPPAQARDVHRVSPPVPQQSQTPAAAAVPIKSAERQMLDQYCVGCHNQRAKVAGLLLDTANVDDVSTDPRLWEGVVAKLRGGAMPPVGRPRPDDTSMRAFVRSIEDRLDANAEAHPNPGRPVVHRLNRAEYANAIRDLLAIDLDVSSLLPPDNSAFGFDNMGEILTLSPSLLERYLSAAEKISRAAVGDTTLRPNTETYRVSQDVRQEDRAGDDLPWGTRGGIALRRYFPVDGLYTLKIHMRYATGQDDLVGLANQTMIETRLDGVKVTEFAFGKKTTYPAEVKAYGKDRTPDTFEFQFPITAGYHVVGIAMYDETVEREDLAPRFPTSNYSFQNDHLAPARIDFVELGGPYDATVKDSPSRQRIFTCHPGANVTADACAMKIVSTLARRAYRRPVEAADLEPLMQFYRQRSADGFDAGIQAALERMLVSPEFLFRAERSGLQPAGKGVYRISDVALASRLSFFLWSSIPDDELLDLATKDELHTPAVLAQQVKRMLADRRSHALVSNFAGQWLQLRDLQIVKPDPKEFPEFDDELRDAFRRETELLFESQLHEDRSIGDLLTANYTFVNERLARHYGIPGVYGSHFRRVELTDPNRRGLLGQSSILTVTSYANRTSPTLRGKWVLQNVLGSPPPAPPPNVPALEEAPGVKYKTMRERMEAHRKNPVCATCHARIDPMGFALENFDAVGRWRTEQAGTPIDASGALDGLAFNGIAELRQLLLKHQEEFATTVTSKLLTYALGRGTDYNDMPAVRSVLRRGQTDNNRWSSIILGIVSSAPFQTRRVES